MKKYLIFILLSLIFTISSLPAGAVKKVSSNPINIASRLILKQDSATIASTLEYYGYTPAPDTARSADNDSSAVFTNPDGNTICFSFSKSNTAQSVNTGVSAISTYPTIQVFTNTSRSHIEKILTELDYIKVGDSYQTSTSKYSTYLTKCTFGPGKAITFQRLKK